MSTEAVGSVGGAVRCSAGFHGALDGPCCIQATPVIQGQAVLGGRRWRWRERGERWWYESLLTASTILRALLEEKERETGVRRGARAKVAGWPTSTVSFTESITPNTQRTLSHAPRSERHTGVDIIFPFPHACVCVNVSMHLHPQTH